MTDKAPVQVFRKGERVRIGQSLNLQLAGLSGQIGTIVTVCNAGGYDVLLDTNETVWIADDDLGRELIL